jgi:hypothetical protein
MTGASGNVVGALQRTSLRFRSPEGVESRNNPVIDRKFRVGTTEGGTTDGRLDGQSDGGIAIQGSS